MNQNRKINSQTRTNATTIAREQRRKEVVSYLMKSMSEREIAARLGVSRALVSKDIIALRKVASDFVFSLAKDSIAVFYKDAIDSVLSIRAMAFDIYKNSKDEQKQLNALKVMLASNESMFSLLQQGPGVMSVRSLEAGLRELQGQGQQQSQQTDINE